MYNKEGQKTWNRKYMQKPEAKAKARYRDYKSKANKFIEIASDEDLLTHNELVKKELTSRKI